MVRKFVLFCFCCKIFEKDYCVMDFYLQLTEEGLHFLPEFCPIYKTGKTDISSLLKRYVRAITTLSYFDILHETSWFQEAASDDVSMVKTSDKTQ